MKYILRETAEGYQEIPAAESGRTLKEGVWQQEEGEVRFLLGEEIHIFDRPEELKISKGDEADLRIPGTDARLYLSGSELLIERGKENHIYLNQRNIRAGQMNLQPGDVLFLATLKIVFEKDQIAVVGNAGQYQASLPERCPKESPFDGFPVYKRSPRLIRRLSSPRPPLPCSRRPRRKRKKREKRPADNDSSADRHGAGHDCNRNYDRTGDLYAHVRGCNGYDSDFLHCKIYQ